MYFVLTCNPVIAPLLLGHIHDFLYQAREFQREDVLGGGSLADGLQSLEVLQGHRVLINALGRIEDLLKRNGEALRAQLLSLPFALGLQTASRHQQR